MQHPPLIERERQLTVLDAALARARAGHGQLVVVEGAAGSGTSSLLGAAAAMARAASMGVLISTGDEFERELGWGVVLQLLERVIARADTLGRAALLCGPAAHAGALFGGAPDHGRPGADGPPAAQPPAGTGWEVPTTAMCHALYWTVANLTDRGPLLVQVDDLHWADAPSVAFIGYLARRVEDLPVVLVVGSRAGVENETSRPRARIRLDPLAQVVVPASLSPEGVAAAVRARRPAAPAWLCDAVHGATGGNPFLVEVSRSIVDDAGSTAGDLTESEVRDRLAVLTSQGLRHGIAERLRQLDPTHVDVARTIAVLGPSATRPIVTAVSGHAVADAERALVVLAGDEWLRASAPEDATHDAPEEDRPVAFHPLIRSAIVALIPTRELEQLHARAMAVLSERGVAPEHLAVHAMASRPSGSADTAAVLVTAARRARSSGAAVVALGLLRRAAQEPPPSPARADVLSLLARTAAVVGSDDVGGLFRHAIDAAPCDRGRLELSIVAGQALVTQRRYREAVALLDVALALDDRSDPDLSAALDVAHLVALRFDETRRSEWKPRLDRLTPHDVEGASFASRSLAAEVAYSGGVTGTDLPRARAFAVASVAGDTGIELAFANPFGWGTAMHALHQVNEYALAADVATEVATRAASRGAAQTYGMAMAYLALMALRRGQLPDALATHGALAASAHANTPFFVPLNATNLAMTYLALGRVDEAEATMGGLVASPYRGDLFETAIAETHAWLALSRLDGAAAIDALAGTDLDDGGPLPNHPSTTTCRSALARGRATRGDLAGAVAVSDLEVSLARAWGAPRALGIALTTAGMIRPGHAGLRLLDDAVEVLSTSQDVVQRGWTLTERGTRLEALGRSAAARADLRSAMAIATAPEHRAGLLERRVVRELGRAGARAPGRAVRGVRSLTPTELLVARLASDRKTNREIAAELFVSGKAVEFHLSNAYRKLEITGRRELGRALDAGVASAGPVGP